MHFSRFLSLPAVGLVTLAVGLSAPAQPANALAGGPITVFVTPGSNGTGTIVITGAIGDYGKTLAALRLFSFFPSF